MIAIWPQRKNPKRKHGWKPHSHGKTIIASKYGNHIHTGKPYVQNMQTNLFFSRGIGVKKRNLKLYFEKEVILEVFIRQK